MSEALKKAILESGLFDAQWYADTYPDVRRRKMDPLEHYLHVGGKANYAPNASFDVNAYLRQHPDLRYKPVPALAHKLGFEPPAAVAPGGAPIAQFTPKTLHELKLDAINRPVCQYPLEDTDGVFSVVAIIPTCGTSTDLLDKCLASLGDVRTILVVNGPRTEAIISAYESQVNAVLRYEGTFNWSRANNEGVALARELGLSCDLFLFCNDDLYGEPGWASALAGLFADDRVIVAAPVVKTGQGTVQSAGCYRTNAGCTSAHIPFAATGPYFVESVTGSAMMVRAEEFRECGGFDEHYRLLMSDTDLCLRLGGCAVSGSEVSVVHHERTSRKEDEPQEDIRRFIATYPLPAARAVYSQVVSRPFDALRVLVLKLDHIGDAAIAIRQIEHLFRRANVDYVLNPLCAGLFDRPMRQVFYYEFFHKDPLKGLCKFDPKHWQDFVDRELSDYDVVIDLRAHGESRHLLNAWTTKHALTYCFSNTTTPALSYHGMNGNGELAFAECTRAMLAALPFGTYMDSLPSVTNIGLHTGASTEVKRWTTEHWTRLAEQLGALGYTVCQFGLPGDERIEGTTDMRGEVPLARFAEHVRTNCEAYIGCDSGPTHLVAQTGMPVIEVVGELVNPREWQAQGRVVSVTTSVPCGPCYHQPCRMGDARCIKQVDVGSVVYYLQELLGARRR